MNKKTMWTIFFVIGMILILFSYNLSRYLSNEYACIVAGGILSVLSGVGILLEMYKKN